MKPTVVNLIFAGVLFFGKFFTRKPLLKIFFQNSIKLQDEGWQKLTSRWIYFFIFIAILNEFAWRTQTEAVWVNFKVWGILPLTFIFTAFQLPMINKHKI